jgi:hypothetical protein
MQDVKFVIEKKYPTGKSFKQQEIPLKERVAALALRWTGGVGADEIVAEVFARYGRSAPKHGAQVLAGWERKLERLVGQGDPEATKLCQEAGLVIKPVAAS